MLYDKMYLNDRGPKWWNEQASSTQMLHFTSCKTNLAATVHNIRQNVSQTCLGKKAGVAETEADLGWITACLAKWGETERKVGVMKF